MAKPRNVTPSPAAATPSHPTAPAPAAAAASPVKHSTKSTSTSSSGKNSWDQVVLNLVNYYQDKTPQRTKLIDAFLGFLVVVGALQFVYCVLAGNYVSLSLGLRTKGFKIWRGRYWLTLASL